MHYDGTQWTDATPSNVASLRSYPLQCLMGESKNNIWGWRAMSMRYIIMGPTGRGTKWLIAYRLPR